MKLNGKLRNNSIYLQFQAPYGTELEFYIFCVSHKQSVKDDPYSYFLHPIKLSADNFSQVQECIIERIHFNETTEEQVQTIKPIRFAYCSNQIGNDK